MKRFLTVIFFMTSLNFSSVYAQDAETIQSLIAESMINKAEGTNISLAWYLPDEFWAYSINSNPDIAGSGIAKNMYEMVTEYTFIAVAIGENLGTRFVFTSEEKMRRSMFLEGQDGESYFPIELEDMEADLVLMLEVFQPILGEFLGEFGANLIFFVFEKSNDIGEPIFDPIAEEDVTLNTEGVSFTWNLPLSSLVPKKRCPKDAELLNGTWNFCPIHGNALEVVTEK